MKYWTDLNIQEKIELVNPFSGSGLSYKEIAEKISLQGLTTKALIGHVFRNHPNFVTSGRTGNEPSIKSAPNGKMVVIKRRSQPMMKFKEEDFDPLHVPYEDMEHHHCKWIYGDPCNGLDCVTVCGHSRVGSKPYCEHHTARSKSKASVADIIV